jgi:hypothetical protein
MFVRPPSSKNWSKKRRNEESKLVMVVLAYYLSTREAKAGG